MISVSGCRQSSCRRLFSAVVFVGFVILPAESQAYDICDDRIEAGEPHDAFSNLQLGIAAHLLAEKVCGAPPTPIAPRFLGVVERDGCGPDTAVYLNMKEAIGKAEIFALKISVPDGDSAVELSLGVAQARARALAEGFGGCVLLLEFHDAQIPPLVLYEPGLDEDPPGSSEIDRQ